MTTDLAGALSAYTGGVTDFLQHLTNANADALGEAVAAIGRAGLDGHLVYAAGAGHSLGGVILYNLLETRPDLVAGRAVFLGSPLRGSSVARVMAGHALGRMMVGEAAINELTASQPRHWNGSRELGLIAGSDSLGLGRLIATELATHSDGTVLIEETRLEGATDHLVLPVSHTSMLFNGEVCRQVVYFLRQGRFDHAATAA